MYKFYEKVSPIILAGILTILSVNYVVEGFLPKEEVAVKNEEDITYGTFLNLISSEVVYSIEYTADSEDAIMHFKDVTGTAPKPNDDKAYRVSLGDIPERSYAIELAEQYEVKLIELEKEESPEEKEETLDEKVINFLISARWLHIMLIVVIFICFSKKYDNRKKAKVATVAIGNGATGYEEVSKPSVTFADVAALDEEKEELRDVVEFLKHPEIFTKLGATIPKGVLLEGKPGTGKTLLAKAVAGEAGVSFVAMSGSEFINKYVGVGADNIRKLFSEAREKAPAIIFIDEIDAFGSKRSGDSSGGDSERNQTIDQFLTELDGFKGRDDIFILAATNRADVLDPALTRPGRFDRTIHINLPDVRGREAILKVHSRNKPLMDNVDLLQVAKNTSGFSGAELENLMNEAAITAAKKNSEAISKEDIERALKKLVCGIEKNSHIISEKEKKITANHEAGHVVVSLLSESEARIREVSIVPHGAMGGYTWHDVAEDSSYKSRKEFLDKLTVLMAGRAAERIVIGDISTGASNDIKVATEIAKNMISVYGMDEEVGPISIEGADTGEFNLLGDDTLNSIGNKIVELVKQAEKNATDIITANRKLLDELVRLLLEKETVTGEEVEELYKRYILVANT